MKDFKTMIEEMLQNLSPKQREALLREPKSLPAYEPPPRPLDVPRTPLAQTLALQLIVKALIANFASAREAARPGDGQRIIEELKSDCLTSIRASNNLSESETILAKEMKSWTADILDNIIIVPDKQFHN